MADLLWATLQGANEAGRRQLHVWEEKALAYLAASDLDSIDPGLAKCVRAYAAGKPVLREWQAQAHPIRVDRTAAKSEKVASTEETA